MQSTVIPGRNILHQEYKELEAKFSDRSQSDFFFSFSCEYYAIFLILNCLPALCQQFQHYTLNLQKFDPKTQTLGRIQA